MKNGLSKRIIAVVMSLILCISVAAISSAVEGSANQSRTITVDTETVVNEDFIGIGTNHWSSSYIYGMNDAYQTVYEERNAIQELKYVRMMFCASWIVDRSLPIEQQKWEYENGIYHWENLDAVNFFQKVKMYQDIGATVIVNIGGREFSDVASWWQVEDAGVTIGGLRSAPANLDAFADMSYAIFERAWNMGYDNVTHIAFFNETNGGSFEVFVNRQEYWENMLKKVHYEFKSHTYTGNSQSPYYNMNARDVLYMIGTELSGFYNEPDIISWLEYAKENLVDEDGTPIYDGLCTHQYPHTKTWETTLDLYNKLGDKYPGIWANEFGPRGLANGGTDGGYSAAYEYSETAQIIGMSNAGYGGAATWAASGDHINTIGHDFGASNMGMWNFISRDIDDIRTIYGERGLYTRYIPKNSKVYKSTVDSDDILCAVYGKDGDFSALLEVEESDTSRELTIDFGSDAAGKTFRRHVYTYPEPMASGAVDSGEKYEYGDLIPVSDKEIVADASGKITDILPVNAHCSIVYTTMDEEVQIVTNENLVELSPDGTIDFDVTEIYGTDNNNDLSNVTWSVYGKARTDTNGGYSWTTENIGTITQDGTYTATGTRAGDTISIKITSNYDSSAYTIIIVEIV